MTNPIIIAGAGPAGMAAALALRVAGYDVQVYERGAEARQQGGAINLWAPAVKALREMGVDTEDIGTPCPATFRNAHDRVRADVQFDPELIAEFGGYIFALPRPRLYDRMTDAIPEGTITTELGVDSFVDHGDGVTVTMSDGSTRETPLLIGADGIHSKVRRQLFGETKIREHRLHVLLGFTRDLPKQITNPVQFVVRHSRKIQASWAGITLDGRPGAGWFFVEAWDPAHEPPTGAELRQHCLELSEGFPPEIREMVETSDELIHRWPIRDLGAPPKHWSKGRVVIAGDAAHATSPYAAYGAGMSIVDGYFLAQELAGRDLSDLEAVRAALERYEADRVAHTSFQVGQAYAMGQVFHHAPPVLSGARDLLLDHTKLLQRQVGEKSPGQIADQIAEMGRSILQPA